LKVDADSQIAGGVSRPKVHISTGHLYRYPSLFLFPCNASNVYCSGSRIMQVALRMCNAEASRQEIFSFIPQFCEQPFLGPLLLLLLLSAVALVIGAIVSK
jgi:hypothetical protein